MKRLVRLRQNVRLAALLLAMGTSLTGCEKIKNKVNAVLGRGKKVDSRWIRDSLAIENRPNVVFRVMPKGSDKYAVPIARFDNAGLTRFRMGDRGWHAFDVAFLYTGKELAAIKNGRSVGMIPSSRGMWEGKAPLDTVFDERTHVAFPCPGTLMPSALFKAPDGVNLMLLAKSMPAEKPDLLGEAELENAVRIVATLVAPTVGIRAEQLANYRREVHQVPGRVPGWPSIVVLYDDPVPTPEDVDVLHDRPRHLIVVLDKGNYGYRPTYKYKTTGASRRRDLPTLKWLDFLDTNNDGSPELFFAIDDPRADIYTIVLGFANDLWGEVYRKDNLRCER